MIDLKPRLLVHTVGGDFSVDPWSGNKIDLSPYGIMGYDFTFTSEGFVIRLFTITGQVVDVNPFASGPPRDLSAYGITGYEVVFGVPTITNSLGGNVMGFAFIALIAGVAWYYSRKG